MKKNEDQLLEWLRRHPRGVVLRVTDESGAIHEVNLHAAKLPRIVQTVRALDPVVVEYLNEKKEIIRACRVDELDPGTAGDAEDPKSVAARFRPPMPPLVASDPETQRFVVVAGIIANAYAHGYEVAFDRLAQMIDSLNSQRADVDGQREAFHRAQIRTLEQQLEQLGQTPATEAMGGELGPAMIMQFLGGLQQARAAAPAADAAAAPNGKAKS